VEIEGGHQVVTAGPRPCRSDPSARFTLPQSGTHDPAPGLSGIFDADQRMEVERINPLRQLPRLAAAVGG
jgi:hypothetical protein